MLIIQRTFLLSETEPSINTNIVHKTIERFLPFRIFKTAFDKLHEHCHTGIKVTYYTFSKYYYITFLEKKVSIFIHCLLCQRKKQPNMEIQRAPIQFL